MVRSFSAPIFTLEDPVFLKTALSDISPADPDSE